jgi:hypothetical protein
MAMSLKFDLQAQVFGVALILLAGCVSWWIGDGPVDVFRKMCIALLYLLAMRGLHTVFPEDKHESRGVWRELRFQASMHACTGVAIQLMTTPANDESLVKMVRMALIYTFVMTALMMALFLYVRRRQVQS